MAIEGSAAPQAAHLSGRTLPRAHVLREVARRPAGLFGLVVVATLLLIMIFAPQIAPYEASAQNIAKRLEGPSLSHLFGTDELGRDLYSRILYGTRIALGVAIPAVLAALIVGLIVGTIAGYLGGWVDNALVVAMDTVQAFPTVILALALLALLGPSLQNVIIVIVVSFAPGYARVARASLLSAKQDLYVEAERALGAGDGRIVGVHILPNVVAPLFILLAMDLAAAITIEAGLSFLGVGVPPPTPSWGVILADGFDRVRDTPWPVLSAGLVLMITTLAFTMLGETLRDVVDPRLSGTRGHRG